MSDQTQLNDSIQRSSAQVLSDRYQVLEKIGEGGMGTVYKARQLTTDRTVAIKFLSGELTNDDARRQRFVREAKSARDLNHPNLVSVIDFGTDENSTPFLVLEYIPGIGLDEILQQKKMLSPHDLIEIFSQVCKGLAHVHHKGIVHRDLKPSNIMVVKDETGDIQVKIVDFGIAKMDGAKSQSITTTGEVLGSPLYMSPEQALGQSVDSRSDIYSLGCMLYEAATGRPPFMGDSPIQTLCLRVTQEPMPFSEAAPFACLSPELEKVVMRALKSEVADRYQTASALPADLRELELVHPAPNATSQGLRTLRAQAALLPPPTDTSRRGVRSMEVAMLGLFIVVFATGAFYGFSSSIHKPAPQAPPIAVAPPTEGQAPKPVAAKPSPPTVATKPKLPTSNTPPKKVTPIPLEPEMQAIVNGKSTEPLIRYIKVPQPVFIEQPMPPPAMPPFLEPIQTPAPDGAQHKFWEAQNLKTKAWDARRRGDYSLAMDHLNAAAVLFAESGHKHHVQEMKHHMQTLTQEMQLKKRGRRTSFNQR